MSLIVHTYDGDVRLPNPNLRHGGGGHHGGHHHHHHHHQQAAPPPQAAPHHHGHVHQHGGGRGGGGSSRPHSGAQGGQPPPGYRPAPGGQIREYRSQGGRRRTRYLLLGATCMIPGLVLYFGGGYLFVAAYNGKYPFAEVSVEALLIRIFWYIGPIFFFIGLIIFVVAYATLCKGIDSSDY